jgi:hypothetical protein
MIHKAQRQPGRAGAGKTALLEKNGANHTNEIAHLASLAGIKPSRSRPHKRGWQRGALK